MWVLSKLTSHQVSPLEHGQKYNSCFIPKFEKFISFAFFIPFFFCLNSFEFNFIYNGKQRQFLFKPKFEKFNFICLFHAILIFDVLMDFNSIFFIMGNKRNFFSNLNLTYFISMTF